jgi:hypothetical protein
MLTSKAQRAQRFSVFEAGTEIRDRSKPEAPSRAEFRCLSPDFYIRGKVMSQ